MNTFVVRMLQMLLNNGKTDIQDVLKQLGLTKRMALYYQKRLNDFLQAAGMGETQLRDEVLYLENCDPEAVRLLLEDMDLNQYDLETKERQECILLKIGIFPMPQFLERFAEEFRVSRRTLSNDLLLLKEYLQEYGITLSNRQKQGYYLEGDELTIRYLLQTAFHHRDNICIDRIKREILTGAYETSCPQRPVENIFEKLQQILLDSEVYKKEEFVFFSLPDLVQTVLLVYLRGKKQLIHFDDREVEQMSFGGLSYVEEELKKLYMELEGQERSYFGLVLQSAKISNAENGDCESVVKELALDIAAEFKRVSGLNLLNSAELFEMFVLHVRSMYYRTKYRIKVTNFDAYLAEVDKAYLYMTRQVMDKSSRKYGLMVDDGELQFISYYFFCMGRLHETPNGSEQEKIVIVCVSGLGSSVYIRYQISRLLEHSFSIVISDLRSLQRVLDGKTRLIISTMDIKPEYTKNIRCIQVSTVLTQEDKHALIDWLLQEEVYLKNNEAVSDILDIIKNHAVIQDQEKLFRRLNKYFRPESSGERNPGLADLLRPEFVRICEGAADWQAGVCKAAEPLLFSGWIQESYVKDTVAVIEEYGTYCEFFGGMLLAHAEPHENVSRPGISVAVFKEPIRVERWEKEITTIFVLAVVDQFSHATALSELVSNLSRVERYKRLSCLESAEEVYVTLLEEA